MKTIKDFLHISIFIITLITFSACDGYFVEPETTNPNNPGNEWATGTPVNPNNPNEVAANSNVAGGMVQQGTPPSTTTNVQHPPKIWGHQSTATTSRDQTLFLPFEFSASPHSEGLRHVYVHIENSDTYWDIRYSSDNYMNGQITLEISVPANLQGEGSYKITYRIEDSNGLVSNVLSTVVKVVGVSDCQEGYFEGTSGLTVKSYDLGNKAGRVRITYDTKSIPDRIDVFYGKQWVHGTGSAIAYNTAPPSSDCSQPQPGYVGTGGFWDIAYDPGISRRLDIKVSGCFGGSTRWEVWVDCPE